MLMPSTSSSSNTSNLPQGTTFPICETIPALLKFLLDTGKIRAIDYAFADFIYQQESDLPEAHRCHMALTAAYVSNQTGQQHTCVDINELVWLDLFGEHILSQVQTLKAKPLMEVLQQARSVTVLAVNSNIIEKQSTPLIVQGNKVYLQRYWQYEVELAAMVRELAAKPNDVDLETVKVLLRQLFADSDKLAADSLDWQKIAVFISARQKYSVITGGPGTGKTTTVTKLLALLQGLASQQGRVLNIQLAAPTGKAAARLTESINDAKKKLPLELQGNLPEQCQTIHRLLGAKPQSPYFKANRQNPLHLDVLVLDEASMVDLPLMAKLFKALPEHGQVILLGDQYQLASVETGNVLADMCSQQQIDTQRYDSLLGRYSTELLKELALTIEHMPILPSQADNFNKAVLQDNLVNLIKSHRFPDDSGIGQLAKAIKSGNGQLVQSLLKNQDFDDIHWHKIKVSPDKNVAQIVSEQILKQLVSKLLPIFKLYIQAIQQGKVELAFHCLEQQQVLCAQKTGFWGVQQINQLVENELHKQGLIDKSRDFYIGRPIMLSKNDHQLKLFNGDIGIVMPDPDNSRLLKVWFKTPEKQFRGLLPSRLPAHDTLYAMTIHKSQGSEFTSVYMCLPLVKGATGGRGLNRELIYTGLTRAKKRFFMFAQDKALNLSLEQQCIRSSGLAERLLE